MWLSWEIWQSQMWAFKRRHKLRPRQTAIHSPKTRWCGWVKRALLNILPLLRVHTHLLGNAVTFSFSVLRMIQSSTQCKCVSLMSCSVFLALCVNRRNRQAIGHMSVITLHRCSSSDTRMETALLHTTHAVPPSRTRADEYAVRAGEFDNNTTWHNFQYSALWLPWLWTCLHSGHFQSKWLR